MGKLIVIRFATIEDEKNIIDFIRTNWNENHIFVKLPEIFKYQHLNNEEIYYVIALDEDEEICGVCGYIPYNREKQDICQALWKVVKTRNNNIGIQMLQFLKEESQCKLLFCNGINKKIIPIHKFLGNHVGKLKQYYRINNESSYNIAIINNKRILPIKNKEFELKRIESFDELKECFSTEGYSLKKPYKDEWYINHRYFEHPTYKYITLGIYKNSEKIISVLFGREIEQNNSKIFRIVDFIGEDNELKGISYAIQKLIDDNNYEYIDFYCYGISHEIMTEAGFVLRDDEDKNIIPNYFEPFEQKNVDIIFFTNNTENFYMFKADGDQDRPNIIN